MKDVVTALNFDNAVMTIGIWLENKLAERDASGNPRYTLEYLLGIELTRAELERLNAQSLARVDFELANKPGTGMVTD